MTTGVRFRQSLHLNSVDIGMSYPREVAFTEETPPVGHDLTQYDSIKLIVFDENNTKIDSATCTVLADVTPGPDGSDVQNRLSVTLAPTGSAGNYFFHFVGAISSAYYQLGRPAKITYYAAPPVT